MTLDLTRQDRELISGEAGEAAQMAMRILCTMAEVYGAERLLDIESAHIDGCLYHGFSGLEFARRLRDAGAQVTVPTTLNVGALDLLHPDNHRGTTEQADRARELMEAYLAMGCRPTWTCAPYQGEHRPPAGAQVAWAESNAIVFANSVLGARTNRYGDFIDICAAITGRAPACGLHLEENRRGRIVVRLVGLSDRLLHEPALAPVLGYLLGSSCGSRVPVIEGLPADTSEDFLKALGAAAASSGAVALFHVVGRTPEAPTLWAALQDREPEQVLEVGLEALRGALRRLSTVPDGEIQVVALGSPHFSVAEFERLLPLVEAWPPSSDVDLVVCTHRLVLAVLDQRGWSERLRAAGVELVVDTCVVVAPILRKSSGVLMTNSGKFAHYAPPNTGLEVVYGSLEECVRSAHVGRVWRDPDLWAEVPSGQGGR
jgi:predicted aconitase